MFAGVFSVTFLLSFAGLFLTFYSFPPRQYCNRIGKWIEGSGPADVSLNPDPPTMRGLPDEQLKAFTDDYGFDYKEAMQNAIDCDGDDPDLSDWTKFEDSSSLPKCLVNFDVRKYDRSKCGYSTCPKFIV